MSESENKPCLVQAGQGFSVNYKNRLLYSKYNPSRSILSIIEKTEILPGTVILCISPILQYGLDELASKLPENCLMLGIEAEPELWNLANTQIESLKCSKDGTFVLVDIPQLPALPAKLEELSQTGKYRRVITMDFSAGNAFNQDFYNRLFEACRNSVSQFWKNRVTLVKFGRKYSANLFKNLKFMNSGIGSVCSEKPVLVCGAGESAVETLNSISIMREKFFIMIVDALLPAMKALNIRPDAVVCEEAQTVITKAFTGSRNFFDYLFVSSTAANSVVRISPEKNIFYTPLFCNTNFLNDLISKNILQNPQEPLGSVGLSAVNLALKIRKNEDVPVYVTGLDFSYSVGQTHAKMSLHEKARRCVSKKIKSFEAFGSAFGNNCIKANGKNGKQVVTTTALSGYAELFRYKFYGVKNLFDAGKTGLPLGISQSGELNPMGGTAGAVNTLRFTTDRNAVDKFISDERNALCQLRDIFTSKIKMEEPERTKKITTLLQNREYLYLHFPDGYRLELSQNFLNRVRIEIDYFLKLLK